MKYSMVFYLLLSIHVSYAQPNDTMEVVATTEKYIQAFYQSKPAWLKETLHPELIKRTVKSFPASDNFITTNGKAEMVELSKVFNSNGKFNAQSKAEIEVLDIYKDIATIKLTAEKWVDYLHLVKLNGKWLIVNVIWITIKTINI